MERLLNIIKQQAGALDQGGSQPRLATIASVNPATATAKVSLQPEGVLSGWLPVLSPWIGNGWGICSLPSPGDQVLMAETGWFATLWKTMAARLQLDTTFIEGDWRSGIDASQIEARLADDKQHRIKAVAVVHNETSKGVTSDIAAVRRAISYAARFGKNSCRQSTRDTRR